MRIIVNKNRIELALVLPRLRTALETSSPPRRGWEWVLGFWCVLVRNAPYGVDGAIDRNIEVLSL
jgi:hypothetical protein